MNISFPLVHISGNRVDTEATITLNALSTELIKRSSYKAPLTR